MWDEETGDTFELGENPESYYRHWWEHAEPLWVTATKQVCIGVYRSVINAGKGQV